MSLLQSCPQVAVPRVLRFVLVGGSGMAVDLGLFTCLGLVLPLGVARAVAIWGAMTWNYLLNRRFTFAACGEAPLWQYALFCLSCSAGAGMNWCVSMGLCRTTELFQEWLALAAAVGAVAGFLFNYLLCCKVVFRSGGGEAASWRERVKHAHSSGHRTAGKIG